MKTIALALACALSIASAQQALAGEVATQSTGLSDFDYNGWEGASWTNLGGVTLAQNTFAVTGLTGSAYAWDQGWGGQTDDNGIYLVLMSGDDWLWRGNMAGGRHNATQFDYVADDAALTDLGTALAGVDWSAEPAVRMTAWANPWGYPGWQLHTRNASFSVTSEATAPVPEPATWAMMIAGFGLMGATMRRRRTSVSFA